MQTNNMTSISLFYSISKTKNTFFETLHDRVILVSLGAVGFNEFMVANEVAGFGELVVSIGATLSVNLAVVDIILSN